jgi:hypothetical protein
LCCWVENCEAKEGAPMREIWKIEIHQNGDVSFFFRNPNGTLNDVPWNAREFEPKTVTRRALEYLELAIDTVEKEYGTQDTEKA